jgi:hypothetical protein
VIILITFLEIAGEVQLRTYGQFLDEYGTQLRGIEEALEDSMCGSWDMNLDPISVQVMYVIVFTGASAYRTSYHPAYSFSDSQVLQKWLIAMYKGKR